MARRISSRKKKKTFTSVRKVAFEERVEPDDLLPKEVISDDLELEAESADLDRDEDTTPIPVAESQALDAAEVQAALPAEDKNCSSEETEVETFQGEEEDEIPADDLEIDHEKSEIETEVPPLPTTMGNQKLMRSRKMKFLRKIWRRIHLEKSRLNRKTLRLRVNRRTKKLLKMQMTLLKKSFLLLRSRQFWTTKLGILIQKLKLRHHLSTWFLKKRLKNND